MFFFKILSCSSSEDSLSIPPIIWTFWTYEVYSDHSLDQIIKTLFENFEAASQYLDQFNQNPFKWAIPSMTAKTPPIPAQMLKTIIPYLEDQREHLEKLDPIHTPSSFLLSWIQHYLVQYSQDETTTGSLTNLHLELKDCKDYFLKCESTPGTFEDVLKVLEKKTQDMLARNTNTVQERNKFDQENATIQLAMKNTQNHKELIEGIQNLISNIEKTNDIKVDFEKTLKCYIKAHRKEDVALNRLQIDLTEAVSKNINTYNYKSGKLYVFKSMSMNWRLCIMSQGESTFVILPMLRNLKENYHDATVYTQHADRFREIASSSSAPKGRSPSQPEYTEKIHPYISQQKIASHSINPSPEIGSEPSSNATNSTQPTISFSETVGNNIWLPCATHCNEVFQQENRAMDIATSNINKGIKITLKVSASSIDDSAQKAIEKMFDTLLKNTKLQKMAGFFDNAKKSILHDVKQSILHNVERQLEQSQPQTSPAKSLAYWDIPTSQNPLRSRGTSKNNQHPTKTSENSDTAIDNETTNPSINSDTAIDTGTSYKMVVLAMVFILLIAIAFPYLIPHLNIEKSNTEIDTNPTHPITVEPQNRLELLNLEKWQHLVRSTQQKSVISNTEIDTNPTHPITVEPQNRLELLNLEPYLKKSRALPISANKTIQELDFYKKLGKNTIKLDFEDSKNYTRLEVDLSKFTLLFDSYLLDFDSGDQDLQNCNEIVTSIISICDSDKSFLKDPEIAIDPQRHFQGQTQNGIPHGYGKLKFNGKKKWEAVGHFKLGQFVKGTIRYSSQLVRVGLFNGVDDHYFGYREHHISRHVQETSVGEFVKNKLVKGSMHFINHSRGTSKYFHGHFKSEKLEGYGARLSTVAGNSDTQEGLFKDGKLRYGSLIHTSKDKRNILFGEFEHGRTLVRGLVEDSLGKITWQQS